MASGIEQYRAVRAHVEQQYPEAEWISYSRGGYNFIRATVEGPDLHHDVVCWLRGAVITDWWFTVRKAQCTDLCLHQTEMSKRLYRDRTDITVVCK